MSDERPAPPGFWKTLLLLLGTARRRSSGRRTRQRELLNARSGKSATNWGSLGTLFTILFMIFLNVGAAWVVKMSVVFAERAEAELHGKIIVSRYFIDSVKEAENTHGSQPELIDQMLESRYSSEAQNIADRTDESEIKVERKLRDAVHAHGADDFVARADVTRGIAALAKLNGLPAMLGSAFLLLWAVMLVFQGEGLELDLQRRRHPMWEWLFSHPVKAGPVFLAEMLSPIAANPFYWSAPLFVGFLYGYVYDFGMAVLATFLLGVPISIAAACLGKALEIAVVLRFSPRTRGSIIGLMGWLGYSSVMLFLVGLYALPKLGTGFTTFLGSLTIVPWPWLTLFLGGQPDGSFSFAAGVAACWSVTGLTLLGSVWFSVWGAKRGLSGNVSAADNAPARSRNGKSRFERNAVYRKELLWFVRDRSAIVQAILIPITVAASQLFNFRFILSHAQDDWNFLCGAAILFGTYFLWVLGPKSLSSEGTALWIALTWPKGLESLLKAKAWLWSLLSTGLVVLILGYAAILFPASILKITLVGIGWFIFSRSMAEKSVTLVSVTSSSGEQEKIPASRRWAAQLGMLTFAIGVMTQQWTLAVVGIVYSYLTAAAMWQNLRARLPFLYDPWSEKLPPPPTLMHAMISISILIEVAAVIMGIAVAAAGRENAAVAQAIGYGLGAIFVSFGVWNFLGDRGVSLRDICYWPDPSNSEKEYWWRSDTPDEKKQFTQLFLGAAGGIGLGLVALGYAFVLQHISASAELLRKSQEEMAKIPGLKASFTVMAVGFAPFAEEYLFRGLLYRALDREWGGWTAIFGSAAFFAIYHPPLSWLPVAMLGATNAYLFKKTGRLAPAIALHMVYNAVVSL